ncbi:MAG TPA: DUF4412 domain-containing protein [Puia sp.]|nr:DUF4412 domain-containing protein [Puia sp.]
MKKIICLLMVAGFLHGASAQFQGTLTYECVHANKVIIVYSQSGSRVRIDGKVIPIKAGVADPTGEKDQDVLLFDLSASKETHLHAAGMTAYTTQFVGPMQEQAMHLSDKDITIQQLGPEKIGEYSCRHIVLSIHGGKRDLWITKDLGGTPGVCIAGTFLYYTPGSLILKKLIDAGDDGVIVKSMSGPLIMTLTGYDKKIPPASMYSIPSGYTAMSR